MAALCQKIGGGGTGLSSFPLAQFLADVSQLHSKSITETFAEIMIKTLASCQFHVIRDIFFPPFFLCHHLSKLDTTELFAFVQTADIICCQRALDLYLASPRQRVLFITNAIVRSRGLMMCHGTFQPRS